MKSKVVRYPPAIARIARRSRSKAESSGSCNAFHSALTPSSSSTAGPVVVPPRGRISPSALNGQLNVYCRVSSAAHAPAATIPAAIAAHQSLGRLSLIAVLRRLEPRIARPADASRKWQLHGEIERIQPERQSEHVDLDALLEADEQPEHTKNADLCAGAARAAREERRAEIVLADRRRRKVGLELRHGPQHVSDEGVGVRPGPDAVALGVGIRGDGLLDPWNRHGSGGTAQIGDQLGRIAEPPRVGRAVADRDRRAGAAQAPAVDLVDGVRVGL